MPKVIIVGGGIAGLASGIAFSNAGWDVTVLEQAAQIQPMGAALSLWPNACAAMSTLGVSRAVSDAAAPLRTMMLATQNGQPILHRAIPGTALLMSRTALQNALLVAFGKERLRLNCNVEHISAGQVGLADNEMHRCDLVMDAGGIRAPTEVGAAPQYAGYGGVLALSDRVEGPGLDGLAAEYWGKDERFGVFELLDNRRYWFYMRTCPIDARMPDLAACKAAAEGWPQSVAQAIAATAEQALIPFAVHAKPPPKTLCAPGIVRVGDAAHAMEPNLGQGACQALEDAAALQAIATAVPVERVGVHYERMRLKRARMFVRESAQARFGAHGPAVLQMIFRAVLRYVPAALSEPRLRAMQIMPDYLADIR